MLDSFGRLFLLIGPLFIVLVGVITTVILAFLRQGSKRWMVLFVGPILTMIVTYGATYLVATFISPSEGSGFLLGLSTIGLYLVALVIYYPILTIAALVQYLKKQKQPPQQEQ